MATAKPTSAQRRCLRRAHDPGVDWRCFTSHRPGTVELNYYWVVRGTSDDVVHQRTVSACIKRGWLTEIIGEPLPGTESMDPLRRAMLGKPRPRTLELTELGRKVIGVPS